MGAGGRGSDAPKAATRREVGLLLHGTRLAVKHALRAAVAVTAAARRIWRGAGCSSFPLGFSLRFFFPQFLKRRGGNTAVSILPRFWGRGSFCELPVRPRSYNLSRAFSFFLFGRRKWATDCAVEFATQGARRASLGAEFDKGSGVFCMVALGVGSAGAVGAPTFPFYFSPRCNAVATWTRSGNLYVCWLRNMKRTNRIN